MNEATTYNPHTAGDEEKEAACTHIRSLGLTLEQVTEMAAMLGHTYITANGPAQARKYFARVAAENPDEAEFQAAEALAWTMLYGPQRSDRS